jgi:hypothetical protein
MKKSSDNPKRRNKMTQERIEKNGYKITHTGSQRGYVSRNSTPATRKAIKYDGKFGKGYKVLSPRWDTTQYVAVLYYTLPKN